MNFMCNPTPSYIALPASSSACRGSPWDVRCNGRSLGRQKRAGGGEREGDHSRGASATWTVHQLDSFSLKAIFVVFRFLFQYSVIYLSASWLSHDFMMAGVVMYIYTITSARLSTLLGGFPGISPQIHKVTNLAVTRASYIKLKPVVLYIARCQSKRGSMDTRSSWLVLWLAAVLVVVILAVPRCIRAMNLQDPELCSTANPGK